MADLNTLADAISKTLSPEPSQRRAAETFLQNQSSTPSFSVALLRLIALDSAPQHVRQATAVYMKNYTISYYSRPDWRDQPANDRREVKSAIVDIMLSVPLVVRRQLSEVLAVIAEHEYPKEWPSLVPELSAKLATITQAAATAQSMQNLLPTIDWATLQGVLETLFAIFDRYPERSRSDELYTEINYSLTHTQEHVKNLFVLLNNVIAANIDAQDSNTVTVVFTNAELLCKVFFCLSWQDLPAYFEDNIQAYMAELRKMLVFSSPQIDAASEDEPSPVDAMQASVLEITNLYETKYDEEFRPYLQQFVQDAWQLLIRRSNAPKFDGVVTTGIKFLTTVSRSADYGLFGDDSALSQVCKSIVIPNIELREEDIELFEDNPVEYVRRDMEGSDTGTRRRGAVELVKGLCSQFESRVTEIFSAYVQELLSPQSTWQKRDTAIYIVTALGWKSGTIRGGATETSSLIDVVEFFRNVIKPELNRSGSNSTSLETPIFTADLIKFVISFRNQIPKDESGNVVLLCVQLLAAREPVVRTYAAACIERILTVKEKAPAVNGNGLMGPNHTQMVPRMTQADLEPLLGSLLPPVMQALQQSSQADEYLMRLLLRVCTVARSGMGRYLDSLLPILMQILNVIIKNPVHPIFNHYLFEAISALIRFNGNPGSVTTFENALMGPLHNILIQDVSEFGPYVFQVMSQMMAIHTGSLPAAYAQLIAPLMTPSMWDRRGYIPGMVQYIETYIRKNSASVVSANQLEPILGVFRKLVASKATDHHGLGMLQTIFETYDLNVLEQHVKAIFSVLMLRLSSAKTTKYTSKLICCLSAFVIRFGVLPMKTALDSVQVNILEMLLRQVWLPEVVSLRAPGERHLSAIALTELACGSELCLQAPYLELGPQILTANVAMIAGHVTDSAEGDDVGDAEEENLAHFGAGETYSAAHSQLRWGGVARPRVSPLVVGKDPRSYLGAKLSAFVAQHNGYNNVIQEKMEQGARELLLELMKNSPTQ